MTDGILQNDYALDWFAAELANKLDEAYELEISQPELPMEIRKIYRNAQQPTAQPARDANRGPARSF